MVLPRPSVVIVLLLFSGALSGPRDPNFFMNPDDILTLWPQPTTVRNGEQILVIQDPCGFEFAFEGDSRSPQAEEVVSHYRSLIFSQSSCPGELQLPNGQSLIITMANPDPHYLKETSHAPTRALPDHIKNPPITTRPQKPFNSHCPPQDPADTKTQRLACGTGAANWPRGRSAPTCSSNSPNSTKPLQRTARDQQAATVRSPPFTKSKFISPT